MYVSQTKNEHINIKRKPGKDKQLFKIGEKGASPT